MRTPRSRVLAVSAMLGAAAVIATGCAGGGGSGGGDDQTLRVAMGSPGEAQIRVWEAVGAEFEKAHEGWTVEFNFMDDDQYQTIGLPNLLAGRNAPDVYFEWVGSRLETRYADGFAADLTEAVQGPLGDLFDAEAFGPGSVDGKIVMVPHIADVTNVLWYNTDIFAEHGLTPPTTWDELLTVCDTLSAAGIPPIASGNKDLWAAGNWLGHVTSRVVGEDAYDSALKGETSFDTPEWVAAFETVKELADHNCVNESINAINDNEGAQLFFQGNAAMHAIGSWLVSWAIDEAPDLNFDFVNWPAMDGAGDQGSVIGVVTGYVVNAKSDEVHQEAAIDFLTLVNSDANVDAFIEAEAVPLALSASDNAEIDERTLRLNGLLSESGTVINPPDTGYDLGTAEAFYSALAAVIGGQTTPEEAVKTLAGAVG
jgi:raffinose/stachyose/melibiose transport system substrate-binding protein